MGGHEELVTRLDDAPDDEGAAEETMELVKGYKSYEELEAKIDNEGIEYFFLDYIGIDLVLDPALKEAVEDFREAFTRIEAILEEARDGERPDGDDVLDDDRVDDEGEVE